MSTPAPTSLWKRVPLTDAVKEYLSGGTPSTKENDFWDGDIAWTTSAAIADEAVTLDKGQRFISQVGLNQSATTFVVARQSIGWNACGRWEGRRQPDRHRH